MTTLPAILLSIFFAALSLANPSAPILPPTEKACLDASTYSESLAGEGILVMHKGKIIFQREENGWPADRPHPLASGTKSFTGVIAAFAIQDQLITLDELASNTLTEWKSVPGKQDITVRHLLTLSSGLDPNDESLGTSIQPKRGAGSKNTRENWFQAAIDSKLVGTPGKQFQYGPSHFYAFGALLERKLQAKFGKDYRLWDYYQAKLFTPVNITIGRIGKDRAGNPNLPGGMMLTKENWARFGQFVLDQGSITKPDGTIENLLKPEFLNLCFEPSANNPVYGLTWWLLDPADKSAAQADGISPKPDNLTQNQTLRERLQDRARQQNFEQETKPILGPDGKPLVAYMAAGLGKQRLYIIPSLDLVVVRFASLTSQQGRRFDNQVFISKLLSIPTTPSKTPQTTPPAATPR